MLMFVPAMLTGRDQGVLAFGSGKKITSVRWERGKLARKEPFFLASTALLCAMETLTAPMSENC